jgi:hypothetical protein
MRRLIVAGGVAAAALVLPGAAFAHGGTSAPVATNFEARISGVEPASDAIEAKVVDGDRGLWLRATANATVLITGVTAIFGTSIARTHSSRSREVTARARYSGAGRYPS